jgi:hypothetical protein
LREATTVVKMCGLANVIQKAFEAITRVPSGTDDDVFYLFLQKQK